VDLEEKIGFGFSSGVYRGTWHQQTVAVKVLAHTVPRSLFVHEVSIWMTLKHPNVLELYGASSASGDPPWFLVCRFCEGGSLVSYLRKIDDEGWNVVVGKNGSGGGSGGNSGVSGKWYEDGKGVDVLNIMLEIARGMEYLHARGVLHGDLKVGTRSAHPPKVTGARHIL